MVIFFPVLYIEPIAKVLLCMEKKQGLLLQPPIPRSLAAPRELRLPPKGAREAIAPQLFPAPSGGRMSEGQEGGGKQQSRLLQLALLNADLSQCVVVDYCYNSRTPPIGRS